MAKKSELKTKINETSVDDFLNSVDDEQKRKDAFEVLALMKQATKEEPKMWGPSIIGFGKQHLKYDSGRELDWFSIGFSPRKANMTIYGLAGYFDERETMEKLGKHTIGKGCLYLKRLSDIDMKVLKKMIDGAAKTGGVVSL